MYYVTDPGTLQVSSSSSATLKKEKSASQDLKLGSTFVVLEAIDRRERTQERKGSTFSMYTSM